jgi:hypothetical protein
MNEFYLIPAIIVIWELLRFSITNAITFYWRDHQDEMMEECPMCFEKVPNLEYHRPRCKKKPQYKHFWNKPE